MSVKKINFLLKLGLTIFSCCFAQFEKDFQLKLILSEPGDTIFLDSGFFPMLGNITLENKKDIIIQGSGISNTILSFSNQVSGSNGLEIKNCKNITLKNFSIQGYCSNAIAFENTDGLFINNLKIDQINKRIVSENINGVSIYKCKNFIVENSISNSSHGSGFVIKESQNGIIRFVEALNNSFGIKIQNSSHVDVHSNNIFNNSGGIILINTPDLSLNEVKKIRVFDNIIKNNNLKNNFISKTISSFIPSGTAIYCLAIEESEIFNNTILNNKTLGIGIFSYLITNLTSSDTEYSPYSSSIYIHDNIFRKSNEFYPALNNKIGILLFLKFYKDIPPIIYDGNFNPKYLGKYNMVSEPRRICILDNEDGNYVNLNIKRNFTSWYKPFIARYNTDQNECNCTQKATPEVILYENF